MPSALLLAGRLLLAAVFVVAGAAKLADRAGTRRTVEDFGLPGRLAAPGALALPLIELALAAALLPAASARAAAVAATALLLAFAAVVAAALARGRRPACNCFGSLHASPIGPWTLVRNVALAGVGGVVAARTAPHAGWIELVAAAGALLVAVQAWLWFELLGRYGRALRRIAELEGDDAGFDLPRTVAAGEHAPPFVLPGLDGGRTSLEGLLADFPEVVLLFTDPGCGACDEALRDAGEERAGGIVAISTGEREAVAAKAATHGLATVLLDERREVATLYGVIGVPTAIVVGGDGRVARAAAVGSGDVAALLRGAALAGAGGR